MIKETALKVSLYFLLKFFKKLDKVNPHSNAYKDMFDIKKYENSIMQNKIKRNFLKIIF